MQHNPYQAPAAGFGPMPHVPGSTGSYEFNEFENRIIEKLAGRVKWWGMLSLVFGGLACVGLLGAGLAVGAALLQQEGDMGYLVMAGTVAMVLPIVLVYLVTGGLYVGSGRAFGNVVRTQGDDIRNIVAAIDKMGRAFRIEVWVTIAGYVIAVLAVIGVLAVAGVEGFQ